MKKFAIILYFVLSHFIVSGQCIMTSTKISMDIPTWSDGEIFLSYRLTKQKVQQLKLNDLEYGFDSIQIRLWYDYSLVNLRELVIFISQNGNWTGYHYLMHVNWNADELTEKILKVNKTQISPKSGWSEFIPKLFNTQIASLPDMYCIEGLIDGWTDGVTYNVEIGTKSIYRFYGYHLPDKFQEYWQAQKMVEIINLIDSEFDLSKTDE